MRVGLVCPYSFDVHGGVQSHVRELAASLRTLGHDIAVLAPGEQTVDLPDYVTTTGRTVPMPYNGSVARVSFGPLVAGRVRRWLADGRFDVVHIHEPATPSVSVLALWAARAPLVATFHTASERTRTLETSAATFLRAGLAKLDAHVAVSVEAERTMARYLDADPVVIPNGIDTGRYAAGARRSGAPTVVFVGRVDEPRKGFDVLLASWTAVVARHPGARLLVVGAGARPGRLRSLPPAVAGRVELLGPLDDAAKAGVLAGADVVVAPNTHGESFGIVLVEAMAAAAAVVASDLPAFRRVLGGGNHGVLFPTGDSHALAEAVSGLLEDRPRRAALGERARRAASAYDWTAVAPRVAEVYAEVLTGRRDAARQAAAG
ncbi:MAG TPA: glycosyltransferase family 4 protein [Marmoricola sp.]|nr:glycosyltransferase family 4 protein [Marmoricola sp.]